MGDVETVKGLYGGNIHVLQEILTVIQNISGYHILPATPDSPSPMSLALDAVIDPIFSDAIAELHDECPQALTIALVGIEKVLKRVEIAQRYQTFDPSQPDEYKRSPLDDVYSADEDEIAKIMEMDFGELDSMFDPTDTAAKPDAVPEEAQPPEQADPAFSMKIILYTEDISREGKLKEFTNELPTEVLTHDKWLTMPNEVPGRWAIIIHDAGRIENWMGIAERAVSRYMAALGQDDLLLELNRLYGDRQINPESVHQYLRTAVDIAVRTGDPNLIEGFTATHRALEGRVREHYESLVDLQHLARTTTNTTELGDHQLLQVKRLRATGIRDTFRRLPYRVIKFST